MKSDVIRVMNTGEGIETALSAASATALYRGLGHKEALHLRLLAEETLGMMRQITKEKEADFWIDSKGREFELHLVAHPAVTGSMRRELLCVSTSGKNEAAKGFTGKLRDIFERALTPETADDSDYYVQGLILPPEFCAADPAAIGHQAHAKQFADVLAAINEGRKPLIDGYEGRKSVEVICAVYESAKKGERVKLS